MWSPRLHQLGKGQRNGWQLFWRFESFCALHVHAFPHFSSAAVIQSGYSRIRISFLATIKPALSYLEQDILLHTCGKSAPLMCETPRPALAWASQKSRTSGLRRFGSNLLAVLPPEDTVDLASLLTWGWPSGPLLNITHTLCQFSCFSRQTFWTHWPRHHDNLLHSQKWPAAQQPANLSHWLPSLSGQSRGRLGS
jgi:hypothetical protein